MDLRETVKQELGRLMAAQLEFSPAAEDLKYTIQVMVEDLEQKGLTDADAGRLEQAFRAMRPDLHRWPTSAMVLDYYRRQRVPASHQLRRTYSEPVSGEKAARNRERIGEILDFLGMGARK